MKICPMCKGEKTIRIPEDVIDDCPQCEGKGKIKNEIIRRG